MIVGRLFLAVPRGCLRFVIVVFPDHTHLLFLGVSFSFFSYYLSYNFKRIYIYEVFHFLFKRNTSMGKQFFVFILEELIEQIFDQM